MLGPSLRMKKKSEYPPWDMYLAGTVVYQWNPQFLPDRCIAVFFCQCSVPVKLVINSVQTFPETHSTKNVKPYLVAIVPSVKFQHLK